MMRRGFLFAIAALSVTAALAHASVEPEATKGDTRIRLVTYDPNNVVLLYTKFGASLLVQFEAGEEVTDMVGGDVEAWGAAVSKARNAIFLKPAASAPDSNIQVITTRRTYNFDVRLAPKGRANYLTVRFRYPGADRAATAAVAAARESEQVRALLDANNPTGNRKYTVQGSSDIAPVEVWDDGRSTFMRFRTRSSIPAFYAATGDDDSLEQIERPAIRDDVVQIPAVRRKFVLRIGRQVACVFNEAYDPNATWPGTNTVSPLVKRSLKGAAK